MLMQPEASAVPHSAHHIPCAHTLSHQCTASHNRNHASVVVHGEAHAAVSASVADDGSRASDACATRGRHTPSLPPRRLAQPSSSSDDVHVPPTAAESPSVLPMSKNSHPRDMLVAFGRMSASAPLSVTVTTAALARMSASLSVCVEASLQDTLMSVCVPLSTAALLAHPSSAVAAAAACCCQSPTSGPQ